MEITEYSISHLAPLTVYFGLTGVVSALSDTRGCRCTPGPGVTRRRKASHYCDFPQPSKLMRIPVIFEKAVTNSNTTEYSVLFPFVPVSEAGRNFSTAPVLTKINPRIG